MAAHHLEGLLRLPAESLQAVYFHAPQETAGRHPHVRNKNDA